MTYYFKVNIMTPIEDQGIFLDRVLEKDMLNEVTQYVQDKTIKGIPVKFRISIYKSEENTKVMSVTINTKNINETDIIKLLSMRVSDNDILKFLASDENVRVTTDEPITNIIQQVDHDKISHELPVENVEVNYYDEEEEEEKNLLKAEAEENNIKEDLQEPIKKVEVKQEKVKLKNNKKGLNKGRLITIGAITFLGISLFSQQLQINSLKNENKELLQKTSEIVKKSEDLNEKSAQIDTFGRFFLTYFYSADTNASAYQDSLANYLDKDLKINDWKTPGRTLKSVHFYGISKENVNKGTSVVSYVIITADKKSSKQELISFKIKKHEDTFKVVSQPTTETFSFKD